MEALDSEKDSKTTFRVIDSTWCTIFATTETTDALGTSIPNGPKRQCTNECLEQSIINNLQNTIVFAQ